MPQTSPRIFYVSYDGLAEPLGRSQILAYLRRLSRDHAITLVSFEKSAQPDPGLVAELRELGITWRPQRYHRKPPVLSTVLDLWTGVRVLRREARIARPDIVHVRSYVPAVIALLAQRFTGGRLLFDIRGFWADERVEGGIWPRGGRLYRIAKWTERHLFARADAIVTLTHASVPQIRAWLAGRQVPIEVIPTCVDLDRFRVREPHPDGNRVIWSGSVGTWYRFDLVAPVAAALDLPLQVLTREVELARRALGGFPASVQALPPSEVPEALCSGDIGLSLIVSSFSKVASAPTRFAEYLAAGMPVIVTRGVGDLEEIVTRERVGVVLAGEDDESVAQAARAIRQMAADPETVQRCAQVTRALFDADRGAAAYARLYRELLG